ncbi:MAG: hypothetical protein ACE5GJ_00110 [Gemmatimonadota bacterium]
MAEQDEKKPPAKREFAQLLRLHERALAQLTRVRDELAAPGTSQLLQEIKVRTGSEPDLSDVFRSVEEAIRAVQLSEATVRDAIGGKRETLEVEGVPNLPVHLQQFLAERAAMPGFTYEVLQDEVRGWVICWKEYTHKGTVRGYGQFYERPYAWIDEP